MTNINNYSKNNPKLPIFLLIGLVITFSTYYAINNSSIIFNPYAKNKAKKASIFNEIIPGNIGTVFVTDDGGDMGFGERGCDTMTGYKYDTKIGEVYHGPMMISPGRIAAGKYDASTQSQLIIANSSNAYADMMITLLDNSDIKKPFYSSTIIKNNETNTDTIYTYNGGVAVLSPDTYFIALSTSCSDCIRPATKSYGEKAPYYIAKIKINNPGASYELQLKDIVEQKRVELNYPVAELQTSITKNELYALTTDSKLHIFDLESLDKKEEIILPTLTHEDSLENLNPETNFFQASLSRDGKYLLINQWKQLSIIVVDLDKREYFLASLPSNVRADRVGGIAFNNSSKNYENPNNPEYIFALHGRISLEIYQLLPAKKAIQLLTDAAIHTVEISVERGPLLSVGWLYNSNEVVVADDRDVNEFTLWTYDDDKKILIDRGGLDACQKGNYPNHVSNYEIADIIAQTPTNTPTPISCEKTSCTYGATSHVKLCQRSNSSDGVSDLEYCKKIIADKNYQAINALPHIETSVTENGQYKILEPDLGTARGSGSIATDYPQQLYYHKGANPHPADHARAIHEVFAAHYKAKTPTTSYEIANVRLFYNDEKWDIVGKYCNDGDLTNPLCPGYTTDADYIKFSELNVSQINVTEEQIESINQEYKNDMIFGFDTRGCNKAADYGWILLPKE